MAHDTQMWFFQNCKAFFPKYFEGVSVLEIGSLNVNGSVRDFFKDCRYLGLDLGPGPGVDLVVAGEDYLCESRAYDVVVSTEVFEHTAAWDLIFLNMLRLVKRNGMIIFSCASLGRPQHGTSLFHPTAAPYVAGSAEYYLNLSARDFYGCVNFNHWFSSWHFVEDLACLYFVGFAKEATSTTELMKTFKSKYDEYLFKTHRLGLPHSYIIENSLL